MEKHELERFHAQVQKLISRVEELEEKIIEHAFDGVGLKPHPHNMHLLNLCGINMTEATGTWRMILEKRNARERQKESYKVIQ